MADARARILASALELFADRSYEGASTRAIAERAGVSQPSLAYHFHSKDELWRQAVSSLFADLDTALRTRIESLGDVDDATLAEQMVREFIAFSAAHPQLHRVILQESKAEGERMDWLVDTHVRPIFDATTALFGRLAETGVMPDVPPAFLYYILTGAGPTLFVLAPECRRLAGFDPTSPEAVATHADAVVGLLFRR